MKSISLFLFLLVSAVSTASIAFEIPLPELVGDYTSGQGLTVQVDFGQPIADVSQVSLELTGVIATSWITMDGVTSTWGGEFAANFAESDPGFWMTGTEVWAYGEDEFYSLTPFVSLFGATSSFLSDGLTEMFFEFSPLAVVGIVDAVGPSPVGTIFSANLVFQGVVGADSESWDQIKALYR